MWLTIMSAKRRLKSNRMIHMKVNVDVRQLLPLMKSFYEFSGIKVTIYDYKFEKLFAYPSYRSDFCTMLSQNDEQQAKCDACVVRLCRQSAATNKASFHKCHAGLIEIAVPLSDSGITIGYLVCGQITDQKNAAEGIRYYSNAQLDSILMILNALVSHIILKRLIYIVGKPFELQLVEYIDNNLQEDLSVSELCRKFAISKSELYHCTGESIPGGIASYIRRRRVEMAKKNILENPDKPLWKVSEEVGFENYQYFLRVFKLLTGTSASVLKREEGKKKNL